MKALMHVSLSVFLYAALWAGAGAAEIAPDVEQKLTSSLKAIFPDLKADGVRSTPVEGLYEVQFGPRVFYIDEDGRYLIEGSIFDLQSRQNLTAERQKSLRLAAVNDFGEQNMIVFSPQNPQSTITVFTDIDCPYCRKMHAQIDEYLKRGIEVRYLLFPRAGVGSDSYKKAVSVWCSEDRGKALTRAKSGQSVNSASCEHLVDRHLSLGAMLGVTGTPAIISDQGDLIPGFVPAERLQRMMNAHQGAAQGKAKQR